jgi:molybdopterin-guanine dinucleotide biosynthesis protein A
MSAEPITGVILAGGRATRWDGQDKGLIEVAGRPMVAHVIERLQPQVSSLILSANRNLEAYEEYGVPVITDGNDEFFGPLAGIASALQAADTAWVAVAPCDAPLLPSNCVARLTASVRESSTSPLAVAHDGERLQSMVALIRRDLRGDLGAFLASGGRKVDQWYARHDMRIVDFSDRADAFLNINRPEDRELLEVRLRGERR